MSAIIFLGCALAIATIRLLWIRACIERHVFNSFYWIQKTKPGGNVLAEVVEFWPYFYMITELWNWSFKRYIVHHDHYEAIEKFINTEMRKENINVRDFAADVEFDAIEQKNDSDKIPKQD